MEDECRVMRCILLNYTNPNMLRGWMTHNYPIAQKVKFAVGGRGSGGTGSIAAGREECGVYAEGKQY